MSNGALSFNNSLLMLKIFIVNITKQNLSELMVLCVSLTYINIKQVIIPESLAVMFTYTIHLTTTNSSHIRTYMYIYIEW